MIVPREREEWDSNNWTGEPLVRRPRRWPDEHCKELAERLHRSYGWQSVWVAADSAETATGDS